MLMMFRFAPAFLELRGYKGGGQRLVDGNSLRCLLGVGSSAQFELDIPEGC